MTSKRAGESGGPSAEQKQAVLRHWNGKGIIVHRKLTHDLDLEISRTLRHYSLEEVFGFIDFYATILEPGVPERQKKYFWSYKWNLWEFLRRGVKKFDGQTPENYLRKQTTATPEAIVFKRS